MATVLAKNNLGGNQPVAQTATGFGLAAFGFVGAAGWRALWALGLVDPPIDPTNLAFMRQYAADVEAQQIQQTTQNFLNDITSLPRSMSPASSMNPTVTSNLEGSSSAQFLARVLPPSESITNMSWTQSISTRVSDLFTNTLGLNPNYFSPSNYNTAWMGAILEFFGVSLFFLRWKSAGYTSSFSFNFAIVGVIFTTLMNLAAWLKFVNPSTAEMTAFVFFVVEIVYNIANILFGKKIVPLSVEDIHSARTYLEESMKKSTNNIKASLTNIQTRLDSLSKVKSGQNVAESMESLVDQINKAQKSIQDKLNKTVSTNSQEILRKFTEVRADVEKMTLASRSQFDALYKQKSNDNIKELNQIKSEIAALTTSIQTNQTKLNEEITQKITDLTGQSSVQSDANRQVLEDMATTLQNNLAAMAQNLRKDLDNVNSQIEQGLGRSSLGIDQKIESLTTKLNEFTNQVNIKLDNLSRATPLASGAGPSVDDWNRVSTNLDTIETNISNLPIEKMNQGIQLVQAELATLGEMITQNQKDNNKEEKITNTITTSIGQLSLETRNQFAALSEQIQAALAPKVEPIPPPKTRTMFVQTEPIPESDKAKLPTFNEVKATEPPKTVPKELETITRMVTTVTELAGANLTVSTGSNLNTAIQSVVSATTGATLIPTTGTSTSAPPIRSTLTSSTTPTLNTAPIPIIPYKGILSTIVLPDGVKADQLDIKNGTYILGNKNTELKLRISRLVSSSTENNPPPLPDLIKLPVWSASPFETIEEDYVIKIWGDLYSRIAQIRQSLTVPKSYKPTFSEKMFGVKFKQDTAFTRYQNTQNSFITTYKNNSQKFVEILNNYADMTESFAKTYHSSVKNVLKRLAEFKNQSQKFPNQKTALGTIGTFADITNQMLDSSIKLLSERLNTAKAKMMETIRTENDVGALVQYRKEYIANVRLLFFQKLTPIIEEDFKAIVRPLVRMINTLNTLDISAWENDTSRSDLNGKIKKIITHRKNELATMIREWTQFKKPYKTYNIVKKLTTASIISAVLGFVFYAIPIPEALSQTIGLPIWKIVELLSWLTSWLFYAFNGLWNLLSAVASGAVSVASGVFGLFTGTARAAGGAAKTAAAGAGGFLSGLSGILPESIFGERPPPPPATLYEEATKLLQDAVAESSLGKFVQSIITACSTAFTAVFGFITGSGGQTLIVGCTIGVLLYVVKRKFFPADPATAKDVVTEYSDYRTTSSRRASSTRLSSSRASSGSSYYSSKSPFPYNEPPEPGYPEEGESNYGRKRKSSASSAPTVKVPRFNDANTGPGYGAGIDEDDDEKRKKARSKKLLDGDIDLAVKIRKILIKPLPVDRKHYLINNTLVRDKDKITKNAWSTLKPALDTDFRLATFPSVFEAWMNTMYDYLKTADLGGVGTVIRQQKLASAMSH